MTRKEKLINECHEGLLKCCQMILTNHFVNKNPKTKRIFKREVLKYHFLIRLDLLLLTNQN